MEDRRHELMVWTLIWMALMSMIFWIYFHNIKPSEQTQYLIEEEDKIDIDLGQQLASQLWVAPARTTVTNTPTMLPTYTPTSAPTLTNTPTPTSAFFIGWLKDEAGIWEAPNSADVIIDSLPFNTEVQFCQVDCEWIKIVYKDSYAYTLSDYISREPYSFVEYEIPTYAGFKSYMSYTAITNRLSQQWLLQKSYAYTGPEGIRQVNDRYCIAVGSFFNSNIGQYIDLELENGTIIHCVMGDLKDNRHTDKDNLFTIANGCCSEFIIDKEILDAAVAYSGNISNICEEWGSPVKYVKVYNKNVLEKD